MILFRNHFKQSQFLYITPLAALMLLSSCEDRSKVAENEELVVQVDKLKADLKDAEGSMIEDPGDQGDTWSKAKSELNQLREGIEEMGAEELELQAAHKEKKESFEKFKKNYPLGE